MYKNSEIRNHENENGERISSTKSTMQKKTYLPTLRCFSVVITISYFARSDIHLIQSLENWMSAGIKCKSNNTDLISINDQNVMDELLDYLKFIKPPFSFWIGLFYNSSTGQWQWSSGDHFMYLKWRNGHPAYNTIQEKCTSMGPLGTWNSSSCEEKKQFVCLNDNTTVQLHLIQTSMSWSEAMLYCRAHYTDLVSITSTKMQRKVTGMALKAGSDAVWIGLRKERLFGQWLWVSGHLLDYTNWAACQSNDPTFGHCGLMSRTSRFKWTTSCCSVKHHFVCYSLKVAHVLIYSLLKSGG
ncbi:lymphocyte antigen 75-like [Protopterus annectens]|uniref:lymphocyte antigen 75-like n=1 Tax=Protopterus annectens TaxID=7888 RepID=UPI001CFB17F2|nr:lymphocyte antigen 75-like [Protopterus annectens]